MNFNKDTGLRKLMRAARQGKIPDDRAVIIKIAEEKAALRHEVYMHAYKRKAVRHD